MLTTELITDSLHRRQGRVSARVAALLAGLALLMAACSAPPPAAAPVAPDAAAPDAAAPPAEEASDATPTTAGAPTPTAAEESAAAFAPDAVTLALTPYVERLDQPLFATHAGDGSGRLFVVEKPGRIRIVADGQLVEQPFLDLTDRVRSSANEQGLLGLAFAPDYATSGYFWVNYTDAGGHTVVSRFQTPAASPDQADPSSEFLTIRIEQPAGNHNGGMIAFGPDGYLWIGMGDGGAANDRFGNGQNPATLLGSMLRLDVTGDPAVPYTIPPDNPTWEGEATLREIWAVGVRNPWRFSFDRATGDLWIADVGQNQYEEINFTAAGTPGGVNYGWPIMEASHCFQSAACASAGLVLPVAEYDHSGHCSVTGGYVYRGGQFPALTGAYLFGDYCSGAIWATAPDTDGNWVTTPMLQSGTRLSSFGEDEAGELYVTDLGTGIVYQVTAQ